MGAPCPSNITTWTPPQLNPADIIEAQHINEIRNAINREKTRRGTSIAFNTILSPGEVDLGIHIQELKDTINNIKSFAWTQNFSNLPGSLIYAAQITELRKNMNDLEDDCLCNCNYCTCNCNYCTCDCNYCTCNCNHCPCNCNHCPCNCNHCPCVSNCPCNCNHCPCVSNCPCNCNHGCTCDCNYCACNCNYCSDWSSGD